MVADMKRAVGHRHDPYECPDDMQDMLTCPPSRPHSREVRLPVRYSDQPMELRTRLCGMGGTAMIGLLIIGGSLFTWTTYQSAEAPKALTMFDVAPPAAPPTPVSETPPGPKQIEKERKQPEQDAPIVARLEVQVPSANPQPIPAAKPVPDPGPPVERTTAPESRPTPPAPHVSTGKPTWEGLVLGALNKVKRYPRDAMFRRQQGVPYIRFVIDRSGKLLSARLERSSGHRSLDDEALALPKRAQPLPKPPEDVKGDTVELVVPVEFFLR